MELQAFLPTAVAAVACVACHLWRSSQRSWRCLQGTIFAFKSWIKLALKSCDGVVPKPNQLKKNSKKKKIHYLSSNGLMAIKKGNK